MSAIEAKLKELNLTLPNPPQPIGAYVPAKQAGLLVFTSGMLPLKADGSVVTGKVGEDLSIEDGKKAAEVALLNALATLKNYLGGLDKIKEVIRATGFVACTADFAEH